MLFVSDNGMRSNRRSVPALGASLAAALFVAPFFVAPAHADWLDDAFKAVREGETKLQFRYRYEFVEQEPFARDANASTLKSRLSYTSGAFRSWKAVVEADHLSVIGRERFNSTNNGRGEFPVVADPEGFDLNQALLKYSSDSFTATFGRQRINHDDQRFIGGVAWRQNEQTFDAVRLQGKLNEKISLDYAWVANVNRLFGPEDGAQPGDWQGNSHFLRAGFELSKQHKLHAFAYLLDFENDNGPPNSTQTIGVGYKGGYGPLSVNAVLATQKDYEDSPLDYSADFYSIALAYAIKPVKFTAGFDVLGSDDGQAAFRTPLATLHKFQGFADKFLGTPADGLEDFYVGVSGKAGPVNLVATWHDFSSNEGNTDYGTEINLVATWPVNKRLTVQAKYADYKADDFATDTTKFWASMIFNF